MARTILTFTAALLAIACTAGPPVAPKPAPKTLAARGPTLDARDQYQLTQAIIGARAVDPEEDPSALDRTRNEWEGSRYRWEVRWVGPLCARPDACMVSPFDHSRFEEPVVQGWLPRLVLDEATHADVVERCSALRACVFTFEGTLDQLVLAHELPTSVRFSDVELVNARDAQAGEAWMGRSRS